MFNQKSINVYYRTLLTFCLSLCNTKLLQLEPCVLTLSETYSFTLICKTFSFKYPNVFQSLESRLPRHTVHTFGRADFKLIQIDTHEMKHSMAVYLFLHHVESQF